MFLPRSRRWPLSAVTPLVVLATALGGGLAPAAAASGPKSAEVTATAPQAPRQLSRAQATKRALRALHVKKDTHPVRVFALKRTGRAGIRITQAGRSAGARSARTTFKAPLVVRLTTRSYLFYADDAPYTLNQHPGRVVVVPRNGSAPTVRKTTFAPVVNGAVPRFLRTPERYRSRSTVFARDWSAAGGAIGARRLAQRAVPAGPELAVAQALAEQGTCIVRAGGTDVDFAGTNRTASAVGSFFDNLAGGAPDLVSVTWSPRTSPLRPFVDALVAERDCRSVLIVAAGGGYATGAPAVNVGTSVTGGRGPRVTVSDLTAADLSAVVADHPDLGISLVLDAPYTGRFTGPLTKGANVDAVLTPGGDSRPTFGYLPRVRSNGAVVRNSANPARLQEHTNRVLTGLRRFTTSSTELDHYRSALGKGDARSLVAWMLVRSWTLGSGASLVDRIAGAPTSLVYSPVAVTAPESRAPTADDTSLSVNEDGSATVAFSGADQDGGPITFEVVSQPRHGSLTAAAGGVRYAPEPNFNGADSFTYRAVDAAGLASAAATVTIAVTAVNDGPTGGTFDTSVHEDDPSTPVAAPGLLAGASDVDGDPLVAATGTGTGTAGGRFDIRASGSFDYDPDGAFEDLSEGADRVDTFDVVVKDPSGAQTTVVVRVRVIGDNEAPVLDLGTTSADYTEDDADELLAPSLTITDTDDADVASATVVIAGGEDTDALTWTIPVGSGITAAYDDVTQTLTVTGEAAKADYRDLLRSVAFHTASDTPDTSARTVTFSVTDPAGTGGDDALTLSVTAHDDPSTAVADADTVAEDSGDTVIDVLANDTDPDNNGPTVSSVGQPAAREGIVTFVDGDVSFTPAPDFNGSTSFSYTLTGGSTATVTVVVTAVNDAPTLAGGTASADFTEGDATGVVVHDAVTVSDVDDADLTGATVSIGTGFDASDDRLSFTDTADITGTYDAATGVLTLTGTDTKAAYQTALRSVRYTNVDTSDPGSTTRVVRLQVSDGSTADASSNTVTSNVAVVPVNDRPTVTAGSTTASFAEGGSPVVVDDTVTVSDVDDANLAGATVQITVGYDSADDVLGFADTAEITGTYDTSTGTLTLSGTDTQAGYRTALRSVTYRNTDSGSPSTATRTVTFTVTDGALASTGATSTIAVEAVNSAPTLSQSSSTVAYTEDDAPTVVNSGVTVVDADDTDIEGATVVIASGLDATEDGLVFADTAEITGSYDSATGVLALSGTATKAAYQAALRAVRYANSDHVAPSSTTRTVRFVVTDGEEDSNAVTTTVTIAQNPDAPTLTAGTANTQTFTEGGSPVVVDDALAVADVDSTDLSGASVSIAAGSVAGDQLQLTDQNGITGSWDAATRTLTVTGTTTVADYQAALRTITFSSTSDDPGTSRTIRFVVSDGAGPSNAVTHDVAVTPVSNAPVLTGGGALSYTENDAATAISPALVLTDADSADISGAAVAITDNLSAGQDRLSFTDAAPISGSYNGATGVLTLSGTGSVAQYQAALRAVSYDNTSDNPSTAIRTVTYTATDGSLSGTATATVAVSRANDAPVADDESFGGTDSAIGNTALVGNDSTDDAPDPAGPQKTISASILSGDTDAEGDTVSVVPGTVATNDGGSVTVQADGDFTFTPAVGTSCSDHSDFFDYTVIDDASTPGADTGRVTIAITDCVWYVDNTAATGGNGTSGTPYDTLAEADTAATTISAYVYVDQGDGTTTGLTGGISLLAGQRLVGAAEDLTVAGTTLEAGVDANRPALSGSVALAAGNTVEGLAITTSGATAIDGGASDASGTLDDLVLTPSGAAGGGISLNGTSGTWNISNTTITATSGAQGFFASSAGTVNFTSAGTISITAAGPAFSALSTTVSGAIDTTTSTAGSYGWALNAVAGNIDLGTGSVSGHTSTEVSVTAGTGNVSYAGTIGNGTGTSAVIQNRTTGAVTLSGDITDTSDAGGGITMSGNSGGSTTLSGTSKAIGVSAGSGVSAAFTGNHTLSITGGGLVIAATGTAGGLTLSGSTGTVVVSGSGNTVTTTAGTALSINGPDIGAAGVTFQRISSNGAATGILLADTGAAGGLTVTGTGAANTGGIINASTGAGVSLTNTSGVVLSMMAVRNGGDDGIRGSGVNGLAMTGTTVTGNGNAAGEDGLDLTELSGVVTITDATVTGNYEDNLAIVNDAATVSALTIDGGTYANNSSTGGGDGIRIENNGTGATTGTIQDATFTNNHGDHLQIATDNSNTATQDIDLTGNTLTSTGGSGTIGGGIALSAGGSAVQAVDVDDNDIDYANAAAISFATSIVGTPVTHWTVNNNRIGDTGVVGSGSAANSGLYINIIGEGDANFLITNNIIRQTDFSAIDAVQNSGSASMNVTMKGNQLLEPGTGLDYAYGVRFVVGSGDGDNGVSCLDLGDASNAALKNGFFGSGNSGQGYQDVRVRMAGDADLQLAGYTGGAHDNAAVNAWLQIRNNVGGTPTVSSSQFDADSFYLPAAGCPQPSLP